MSSEGGDSESSADDWRTTLYWWRGALRWLGAGTMTLQWSGTWVPSTVATASPPTDEDYERNSSNAFVARVNVNPDRAAMCELLATGSAEPQLIAGIAGKWLGHYMMDNDGSGTFQRYSDVRHDFTIAALPTEAGDPATCCAAVGSTLFGPFISVGVIERRGASDRGLRLTLVRRYIDDSDPRASWTTEDLLRLLTTDAAKRAPWTVALPYRISTEQADGDAGGAGGAPASGPAVGAGLSVNGAGVGADDREGPRDGVEGAGGGAGARSDGSGNPSEPVSCAVGRDLNAAKPHAVEGSNPGDSASGAGVGAGAAIGSPTSSSDDDKPAAKRGREGQSPPR